MPDSGGHGKRFDISLAVVSAVLGWFLSAAIPITPGGLWSRFFSTSISIESPSAGDELARCVRVTGSTTHLRDGQVWASEHGAGSSGYYNFTRAAVHADGTWEVRLLVGKPKLPADTTPDYQIQVYVLPSAEGDVLAASVDGWQRTAPSSITRDDQSIRRAGDDPVGCA